MDEATRVSLIEGVRVIAGLLNEGLAKTNEMLDEPLVLELTEKGYVVVKAEAGRRGD
jgi:hypothetical protein